MIPSFGSHALKALTPQTAVYVDRSRCVRHRCNRSECSKCMEVCMSAAVSWGEQGLRVAPAQCTQCLSCLAACPTAALHSPGSSLLQVLSDLAAHPEPVLGCIQCPDSKKHAQLPCLGCMADPELMLLFALVFTDGVQLDLAHCLDCPNGHVLENIYTCHAFVSHLLTENRIQLVVNGQSLNYQPAALSRRELFGYFRERSSRAAAVMVRRLQASESGQSYGSKQVPLVRTLLLKVMETLPVAQKQQLADQLFGHIVFTSDCSACGRCVGVCPTGALDPVDTKEESPMFNSQFCVACASCSAFCQKQGVELTSNT